LLAVCVEMRQGMSPDNRARLAANMRLAEQLGAETATLYGDDVAKALSDFALSRNVTQIVIGQPLHGQLRDLVRPSPVPRLIRLSHGISVHVIPGQAQRRRPNAAPAPAVTHRAWPLRSYLEPLLAIAVVTGVCSLLQSGMTHQEFDLLYLLPVLTSATRLGRGPAIFAALVGTLSLDFFFAVPRYTLTVADARSGFTLLVFLAVGLLISHLTARVHEEAQSAKAREARTHALYRLSRAIGATSRPEQAAQVVAQEVCDLFDKPGVVLLPDERGQVQVAAEILAATAGTCATVQLAPPAPPAWFDDNERATAIWAFEHGESAGSGTDTLSGASALYVPMKTAAQTWGLLGLLPAPGEGRLTTDELHMLEALAGLAGLALERMKLTADARRAELLSQAEAFRQALLDSVSHDLRTPLAALIGAATSYLEDPTAYDSQGLRRLLEGIRDEAGLMNSLIEKMLDMARLESGSLAPTFDWCDMQDLIGTAVTAQESQLAGRSVAIHVPEGLPLVRCDFVLVERVLSNLLDNAAKYSPPGSPLEITARRLDGAVEIAVLDRGPGIPATEREAIFGKFYRLKHPGGPGGTGLGLSIAQGIIQAHGGRVWVEDRPGGGTRAVFTLPQGDDQPGPAPEKPTEAPHEP
jgi:two-component system sensor histidine kinase KdpD